MALLLTCLSLVRSVLTANSVGSGYAEANIASLLIDADAVPWQRPTRSPSSAASAENSPRYPGDQRHTFRPEPLRSQPYPHLRIPARHCCKGRWRARRDEHCRAGLLPNPGRPLLAGRELGDADTASSPPVAVISAGLAAKL